MSDDSDNAPGGLSDFQIRSMIECAEADQCTHVADLHALVAEVRRLRAEVERLGQQVRKAGDSLAEAHRRRTAAAKEADQLREFERYREQANRTRRESDALGIGSTVNAALGLAGETGEVVEIIKKAYYHGVGLDREKLKSELGDVLFYLDWLASLEGFTLQEVADANITKLKARYPDGFVGGGGNR